MIFIVVNCQDELESTQVCVFVASMLKKLET